MIIMGIDPGTARAGWGIIHFDHGEAKAIAFGCIETDKSLLPQLRLKIIFEQINDLMDTYLPSALSVEELFHQTNAKTVIPVAQARGIVLLTAAIRSVPVFSYSPPHIKATITGYGYASKLQIGKMIQSILHLSQIPKPDDTADALAIALVHAYNSKMKVHI